MILSIVSGQDKLLEVGQVIGLKSGQLKGVVERVEGMFVYVNGWNPQYDTEPVLRQKWHLAQVAGLEMPDAVQRDYEQYMRSLRAAVELDMEMINGGAS